MNKNDLKKTNAELLKLIKAVKNQDLPMPFEPEELKQIEEVQRKVDGLIEQFEIYEEEIREELES